MIDSSKRKEGNESLIAHYSSSSFSKWISAFIKKWDTLDFAIKLIRERGPLCLYRGMTSALVGSIQTNAIYFCSYQFFKSFLSSNLKPKTSLVTYSLITSFLAATITAILSNPIWILNNRMTIASQQHINISNIEMIKLIYQQEGLSGFFKGLTPALILTINPVIQFIIYEVLKKYFLSTKGHFSTLQIIITSIISKLITTLITYPILTIKTLFQANRNKENKEIIEIIEKLFKNEGISGFYKGFSLFFY